MLMNNIIYTLSAIILSVSSYLFLVISAECLMGLK